MRAIVNTLPFDLTEKLEGWLIGYVFNRIVLVPTRNSVDYISPREKLNGRKISVDKESKHGFGDCVQVHSDSIYNSNKARTQGAIALMSAGNLEGSWYYYLLGNQQIVKRTKATTISMSDEVIAHLNQQAPNRKISKNGNSKQPIFERHINLIDDIDDINDTAMLNDALPNMIEPYNIPDAEERAEYEIEREFEIPDNIQDGILGDLEYTEIVDELIEEIDSDANYLFEYDDTPVDNQALLDDILGNDSDEESVDDEAQAPEPAVPNTERELRRSARKYQLGKWNKKIVEAIRTT
jgi:hypothetical protein